MDRGRRRLRGLERCAGARCGQGPGGVAGGMLYMTGTGGEVLPAGLDPKSVLVERSVPLSAMEDALLAWEMNGEPVPLAHGGPLRLIVPGYTGVNNIKYIKQLAFTAKESEAHIMSHGYRISPPGSKGDPSQPSVQEMSVKSWINSPIPEDGNRAAGLVQIQGVAFGGMHAIKGWRSPSTAARAGSRPVWWAPIWAAMPGVSSCLRPRRPRAPTRRPVAQPTSRAMCSPRRAVKTRAATTTPGWADHAVTVTVA